jgi:hypothetical protein
MVTVNCPCCFIKRHIMHTYGRVEVQLHAFVTLALVSGRGFYWIGGWLGHRAGLDAAAKKANRLPGIEPESSSLKSIGCRSVLED